MQRALDRAHRAIFAPQGLSAETKLVFILYRLRHVLLPEGEMGKPHNLLWGKVFMTQGVDSEFLNLFQKNILYHKLLLW